MKHNLNILVVDDEDAILQNIKAYLEDEKHIVTTVSNAEDAFKIITRQSFDIGLFDIHLPGMNGDELAVKTGKARPGMKILLHTGFPLYSIPNELHKLGITEDHVLHKPLVNMDLLLTAINKLLSKKENV